MADKSWNLNTQEFEETPKEVNAFFKEIDLICKKHNMSISHEDNGGNFIIEPYLHENINWLDHANIDI